MKTASAPNLNRETTSITRITTNFFTFFQDPNHRDDTTLNKRPKIEYSEDTEASETSPFKDILSPILPLNEMNENHFPIDGSFYRWDQMDQTLLRWPPSPNGSDTNVSVGSNQFIGDEDVSKAWRSDRHQPMRGSIIQQIFRAVHESHSPGTKKNKEWQEKLRIVVLKAEEILYSKANSEGEYMDLATLWDRVNDAINTIIKRHESAETGDYLPPCVEAALNLGCVPVRASRSQRNANRRSYLGQKTQDPNNTTNELRGPNTCSRI